MKLWHKGATFSHSKKLTFFTKQPQEHQNSRGYFYLQYIICHQFSKSWANWAN